MESERIAIGDRISQLPDEILHHILSCPPLATRDLLLVAMLSKRWRYLWKSSPFLNLDDGHYLDIEGDMEAYSRFVDTVLLLRDKMDVHSFRLSLCLDMHPHGQERLYQWAQYAVRHNPKVIELKFHTYKKEVRLPSCLFNCQSVEELAFTFDRIYSYGLTKISPPELVQLGQLKKLYLKHMDLDGDAMNKIFSGCPNLEKLILEGCWLISTFFLVPTLQDLTLKKCIIGGGGLFIVCPQLLSFNFVRGLIDVPLVLLWKLASVVNATVLTNDSPNFEDPDRYHYNAIDFIQGLTSAKTLKIISARLQRHLKNDDESSQEHSHENDGATSQERSHENEGETCEELSNGDEAEPSQKRAPGNEGETSQNHSRVNEGETSQKHSHADGEAPIQKHNHEDEGEPSQKRAGETEGEPSQKVKQLWFHCPNSAIQCRVQCGEDNDRLLDLVSKVIVSKYTLPDQKVCIIPCGRVPVLDNC